MPEIFFSPSVVHYNGSYNVSLRKGGLDYIYNIMKIIITESQYKRLFESEQKVLVLPTISVFGKGKEGWETLQEFLQSKGNPPFSVNGDVKIEFGNMSLGKLVSVEGDLNMHEYNIGDLGDLKRVEGNLILWDSYVDSGTLGNLEYVGKNCDLFQCGVKSLGKLKYVGGTLCLAYSNVKSLGELKYVGGDLEIYGSKIKKKYSEEEIRSMVDIQGSIITEDPEEGVRG